jgi:hypothetical protein
MAYERPPRTGTAPGTRTLDELKSYAPPAAAVLRQYTVGRRPSGAVESLADVARAAGQEFWKYIEFVFPGCAGTPECVNWYLRHRYNCTETKDGKNRRFRGGEQLPLPKLDGKQAKPQDPPPPPRPGYYDRAAAVQYARTWVKNPNPTYPPYLNDCTSFVSQALLAGGWPMIGGTAWDYNDNDVWWYGKVSLPDYEGGLSGIVERIKDKISDGRPSAGERSRGSQTWAGAHNFAKFLRGSGRAVEVAGPDQLSPGDVIQMRFKSDKHVHHTMIVVARHGTDLEYAQHTDNKTASYENHLLKVLPANEELVHWKLKDLIAPPVFAGPAPGGVRRGVL